MGKKKFEDILEYDPIEDQARRDAAKAASKGPSGKPKPPESKPFEQDQNLHIVDGGKGERKPSPEIPISAVAKKAKARTFTSAGPEHDVELDAFISRIKQNSGTNVSFNVLSRAAIETMIRAEEQIIEEIRKSPPPPQPSTSNHDAYVEFEGYWVEIVAKALSKLRPMQ